MYAVYIQIAVGSFSVGLYSDDFLEINVMRPEASVHKHNDAIMMVEENRQENK